MEQTIEELNSTFLEFNDKAVTAGLLESCLAEPYRNTVERFVELTNDGAQTSSDNEEDEETTSVTDDRSSKHARDWLQSTGQAGQSPHPRTISSESDPNLATILGYQSTFEIDFTEHNGRIARTDPTQQANDVPILGWDFSEQMQYFRNEAEEMAQYPADPQGIQPFGMEPRETHFDLEKLNSNIQNNTGERQQYSTEVPQIRMPIQQPMPRLGKELPLPSSYSHYETSFVRRLIRASLEESYRLLLDPGSRPEDLQRLSTFAFCFIKAPQMLKFFQNVMVRTARENLELWNVPLYHIGDAGLHYPRAGIDASSDAPSWWANRGPMGPLPAPQPENPVPEGIADILEYSGVDGEWFDSNDVAEYLRSKGLRLDGNSSMIEITESDEAILQESYVNSQSMSSFNDNAGQSLATVNCLFAGNAPLQQSADWWSQAPSNLPEILNMDIDVNFGDTNPWGHKPVDQSLDLPMLPEFMAGFPKRIKKYLDVGDFVSGRSSKLMTCVHAETSYRTHKDQHLPWPYSLLPAGSC